MSETKVFYGKDKLGRPCRYTVTWGDTLVRFPPITKSSIAPPKTGA